MDRVRRHAWHGIDTPQIITDYIREGIRKYVANTSSTAPPFDFLALNATAHGSKVSVIYCRVAYLMNSEPRLSAFGFQFLSGIHYDVSGFLDVRDPESFFWELCA